MSTGNFSMIPIDQDNLLVIIALALCALLATVVIVGMVVGARNKRLRREAEHEEEARLDELRADSVEAVDRKTVAAAGASDVRPAEPLPELPVAVEEPVAEPRPLADEPIAAAAPLDATPASIAANTPQPDVPTDGGSITQLKGLGPKIANRLEELGITRVDQLAWIDDAEAADLDAQLAPFQGRMARDRWREQARLLAQGDRVAYEAQFGRLG